jgi:catechol 2,3-dioxygenase-like lactoylglutathione lyase family enzyme
MAAMITGLDHAVLLVRDLDQATADYSALFGRDPDWRGAFNGARHVWFAQSNMALDIIAADGAGEAADGIRAQIDKFDEGLWALGFAVPQLDVAQRTLERRGVAMFPPAVTVSRSASGEIREWRTAMARRNSTHGIAQMLVENAGEAPTAHRRDSASITGLDHVVVRTPNPDRALAHYGARLGLDLRLARANEQWGSRLFFFRCGDLVVEVGAPFAPSAGDGPDSFGGLAWRMRDAAATHARLSAAGFALSELRPGRKAGSHVFTVKNRTAGVPTLMIESETPPR